MKKKTVDPVDKILVDMLRENTGIAMCDSGGAREGCRQS